jgi:HSP20 family protein
MWRRRRLLDEIEALEREIDEALEAFFYERPMWDISASQLEPLAHLTETEDKITVSVDLPLVKKEDIKLNVTGDVLEVDAKMQRCIKFERWGTVQRNCEFKSFRKVLKLPSEVIPEEAKAKFKQGILTVELPKRVRRHKIEIE